MLLGMNQTFNTGLLWEGQSFTIKIRKLTFEQIWSSSMTCGGNWLNWWTWAKEMWIMRFYTAALSGQRQLYCWCTVTLFVSDSEISTRVLRNTGCRWNIAPNFGSTIYPVLLWARLYPKWKNPRFKSWTHGGGFSLGGFPFSGGKKEKTAVQHLVTSAALPWR